MTSSTTTTSYQPILLPQLGFPGARELQPVPGYGHDQFTVGYFLQVLGRRGFSRTGYHALREATTPRTAGAYNVVVLTGGAHRYYRSVDHSNRHAPWWYRLADGIRDCFVVWGRKGKNGDIVFDSARPARTSNGRGVIYTRWPVFDTNGQLTHYGWQILRIEFAVLDRNPVKGDTLKLDVKSTYGQADIGQPADHDLYLHPGNGQYEDDSLWCNLTKRAKASFEANCTSDLEPDAEKWRVWFLNQLVQDRADRTKIAGFHDTCGARDWITALDSATEAWQLAAALKAHRRHFPEVAPDIELPKRGKNDTRTDREIISQDDQPGGLIRGPGYEGTTGGMESRLLAAYLDIRPERSEELMAWMRRYVDLASGLRNYTGD